MLVAYWMKGRSLLMGTCPGQQRQRIKIKNISARMTEPKIRKDAKTSICSNPFKSWTCLTVNAVPQVTGFYQMMYEMVCTS